MAFNLVHKGKRDFSIKRERFTGALKPEKVEVKKMGMGNLAIQKGKFGNNGN